MPRRDEPRPRLATLVWAQPDRSLAYLLLIAAGIVFAAGSYQVGHSPYAAEEVAYLISGGVGALIMLSSGVSLLLVADFRDEHHKLARLERAAKGRPLADPRALLRQLADLPLADAAGGPGPDLRDTNLSRVRAAACAAILLLGAFVVGAGWRTASTTPEPDRALEGLALASAGLAVIVIALAAVVITIRRSVNRRSAEVLASVAGIAGRQPRPVTPVPNGNGISDEAWTAPGLERYHRRGCPALHSRTGEPYVVSPRHMASLVPCLLCHHEGRPDA